MGILITGAAGFIGYHLARRLLDAGEKVIGYDNLNDYYDVNLKNDRLNQLSAYSGFDFIKGDIADAAQLSGVFSSYRPETVVNLAAQAGVRYSLENPNAYIESNMVGFFNVLEACRHYPVKHLVYASSSSVYGNQQKTPFSIGDDVSKPVSLYAATKVSNELMAYTYSCLYHIPATGLRFFTVYGPWGRPDMAYFSFTDKLVKGLPIKVYNHGKLKRDFTFIDDIAEGIMRVIAEPPRELPFNRLYNIGNNHPVELMLFIRTLEKCLRAEKLIHTPPILEFLPMQAGDVYQTFADVDDLMKDFGFKPKIGIDEGLARFARWYKEYYANENKMEDE